MNEPGEADEVILVLASGQHIRFRREVGGGMEICHERACLSMPATAAQFLALMEFFETLAKDGGT